MKHDKTARFSHTGSGWSASHSFYAYVSQRSVGRDVLHAEYQDARKRQAHTPVSMMYFASREWWWFRGKFYVHTDDEDDPSVIKGLILQMEQRKEKQRERARRIAEEDAIARAPRHKRSKGTPAESKSPLIEWTKELESLRTLSLRQPWAWLVVNGYKDVENRSWRTNHRGPLLIHASSTTTTLQADLRRVKNEYGIDVPQNLEFGGVVGVVDVIDCVKKSGSRWHFRGSWGWVIAIPRRLPFRKCKGAVGFFKLKSR